MAQAIQYIGRSIKYYTDLRQQFLARGVNVLNVVELSGSSARCLVLDANMSANVLIDNPDMIAALKECLEREDGQG